MQKFTQLTAIAAPMPRVWEIVSLKVFRVPKLARILMSFSSLSAEMAGKVPTEVADPRMYWPVPPPLWTPGLAETSWQIKTVSL